MTCPVIKLSSPTSVFQVTGSKRIHGFLTLGNDLGFLFEFKLEVNGYTYAFFESEPHLIRKWKRYNHMEIDLVENKE